MSTSTSIRLAGDNSKVLNTTNTQIDQGLQRVREVYAERIATQSALTQAALTQNFNLKQRNISLTQMLQEKVLMRENTQRALDLQLKTLQTQKLNNQNTLQPLAARMAAIKEEWIALNNELGAMQRRPQRKNSSSVEAEIRTIEAETQRYQQERCDLDRLRKPKDNMGYREPW